jgi:N-acetylmuramate 1-kinase
MSTLPATDARFAALQEFVAKSLGTFDYALAPASEDASFRRYFRVTPREPVAFAEGDATLIAMDAPPPMENCQPYLHIAGLLRSAGVHAPRVFAQDLAQGFMLVTDLGTTTYLDALTDDTAPTLYAGAIDSLIKWQLSTRVGGLPEYDEPSLTREVALFPDWYVGRHLRETLQPADRSTLDAVVKRVIEHNLAEPKVFVHRDYHSRNLMVCEPNPGVLDFQDAVHGPLTYDLVSLLRDAYIDWDEEREIDWSVRYWERARKAGLPIRADFGDFWRDFEWMGVQRQLKVLGIFARLSHRDGKHGYVKDMPRVMGYLSRACARYRELEPLQRLLDTLADRAASPGKSL